MECGCLALSYAGAKERISQNTNGLAAPSQSSTQPHSFPTPGAPAPSSLSTYTSPAPCPLQVGVTGMLIASKYEEIWAPEVKDFVYISDKVGACGVFAMSARAPTITSALIHGRSLLSGQLGWSWVIEHPPAWAVLSHPCTPVPSSTPQALTLLLVLQSAHASKLLFRLCKQLDPHIHLHVPANPCDEGLMPDTLCTNLTPVRTHPHWHARAHARRPTRESRSLRWRS